MFTLEQIKAQVDSLAMIIGAKGQALPTYGSSEHTGRPHIEISGPLLHYVVAERGQEYSRFTTTNLDGLLYKVFSSVSFWLASKDELANRDELKDFRRYLFQRQKEIMGNLSLKWQEQIALHHAEILKQAPFDDLAGICASTIGELMRAGKSYEEAKIIAYSRYQDPKNSG